MPTTYVALLRGINVGGHMPVPMAELRSMFDALGHRHVATYVQSGNVVFESDLEESAGVGGIEQTLLADGIAEALLDRFGFSVGVVMRSARELAAVAERHPFSAAQADPARLHVLFLADVPTAEAAGKLDAAGFAPDEFAVEGREVYVHYPNGQGRSKLTLDAVEAALETTATGRNWRTVGKLLEMVDAAGR